MHRVRISSEACKGVEDCGICIYICPKRLFRSSEKANEAGYLPPELENEAECTGCQNCMIYCPDFAIVSERDPDQVSADIEEEEGGAE